MSEENLSWWEKFQKSEHFVLFVWGVITIAIFIIVGVFVAICRCCFFKSVKVDSMGLSTKDYKNPTGSIVLTEGLQQKMKLR